MRTSTNKLIKGVILYATFYIADNFIGGADGMEQMKKQISFYLNFLPQELAGFIASLTVIIIGTAMIYCFASGLYRICTYNLTIPQFENNK